MFYTYVIQSTKSDYWYTGSTNDLRKRFNQHNSGKSTYTKKRGPYKLIYYEAYLHFREAKRREVFLRGGKGHEQLKIQLQDSFKRIKYKYT